MHLNSAQGSLQLIQSKGAQQWESRNRANNLRFIARNGLSNRAGSEEQGPDSTDIKLEKTSKQTDGTNNAELNPIKVPQINRGVSNSITTAAEPNSPRSGAGFGKDLLGLSRRHRGSSRQAGQKNRKVRGDLSNLDQNSIKASAHSSNSTQFIPDGLVLPQISSSSQYHKRPSLPSQQPKDSLPAYSEEHTKSASTSIKGLKPGNPNWLNQDNFFIVEKFEGTDINIYCVLDGHGENGHHVSRMCRESFPQIIKSVNLDMKRAFDIIQNELSNSDYDVRCSGATCVLVSLNGNRLSVCNCGDSRAVLGRRNSNGSVSAHALTNDHKPDRPEERKRIIGCGGHLGCRQVLVNQPGRGPVSMPVGPCRVWYQHRGETLGLAMSRSLGDTIVHKCGVSAEPEIIDYIIDENDEFIILATDGIWDVMDNNQVVQMVYSFVAKSHNWNALEASASVSKFARSRWEKLSPMVDDITCVVIKLR